MKKIIGIFMLAVMVTVGSAFTAEDFDGTILSRSTPTGTWTETQGPTCNQNGVACRINLGREDVDPSYYQSIGNAAPSSPGTPDTYPFGPFDHDNNAVTGQVTLTVLVGGRFAQ